MPFLPTSTEWYEQSSLLLKARPSTTRITSKYTVLSPSPSKIRKRTKYAERKSLKSTADTSSTPATAEAQSSTTVDASTPTATFTLKTYDPVSGICLQYETNKAAEVGRLVGSLGRLGKHMAAVKTVTTDLSEPSGRPGVDTPGVEKLEGDVVMADVKMTDAKTVEQGKAGNGGGGGGKKKKKGKK
ncbi:hypothetical protein M011DRAFT_522333 [Sporormia fimetaria CBS 119925]|uniref:SRP9 domain-containing protein n=1 Tax=Sporormia fimetaria CBS 119925 TaxID=1340428 RepID=A0A6A6UV82_9PLEO|nr:hypothetical protein M011DRAFT_522333 [Sporormia fimetaria CBS 119925]